MDDRRDVVAMTENRSSSGQPDITPAGFPDVAAAASRLRFERPTSSALRAFLPADPRSS